MARTVTVEHSGDQYVWNGRGWYNARDYTVPSERLAEELGKLLPPDNKKEVLAEIAEENWQRQWKAREQERRRKAEELLVHASALPLHVDLLSARGSDEITYQELLSTKEWRERRVAVLVRDGFQCRDCKCNGIEMGIQSLEIHHCYYILNKVPWDYPDDDLVTLCRNCHINRHRAGKISVYEEVDGKLIRRTLKPCIRCLGAGVFPQWLNIQEGICFRCRGARFEIKIRLPG